MTKKEEKAIEAVAEYLRSLGWSPLLGGFEGIEQGDLKHNFKLIFEFTETGEKYE